jgi:glycosyltransferase involved in cell wall biosynthesis
MHSAIATLPFGDARPVRRALRVSVVTETYPPEVNGVAASLSRVVDGLCARRHHVQLIRPCQGDADRAADVDHFVEVLVRGFPIPRYPQLRMGLPARRALVELWTRHRPDLVHVVTEGPLGWSALQAATQLGLPVATEFRTNFHAYSRHYGLQWLHNPIVAYLRRFHNRAACTMVPTVGLQRQLQASGFERLKVVARGVDTGHFDPARRSERLRAAWGADPGALVVLCVGRLAAEKNLGLLIDAYDAMRQCTPRVRLVLVGDGPQTEALRRRCPSAVLAGLRRGDDLAAHYASADAFFFPSLTETFGNVVPEAMASGLPVLGFDYAAPGQLVRHGVNGWLAPVEDPGAWLAMAVRQSGRLEHVRTLGAMARQTALELGWDRIVAQVEAEYEAALSLPQAGRPRPVRMPAAAR